MRGQIFFSFLEWLFLMDFLCLSCSVENSIFLISDFVKISDVSTNLLVFDRSTSFETEFLMISERLLFSTPFSRNRHFCYLNRVCFLFENVESETLIALAGFFGFS